LAGFVGAAAVVGGGAGGCALVSAFSRRRLDKRLLRRLIFCTGFGGIRQWACGRLQASVFVPASRDKHTESSARESHTS